MQSQNGASVWGVIAIIIKTSKRCYIREVINHGEAKRRFHIIKCGTNYTIKKRFGPFWFYVRKGFKKLSFTDFGDVVRYVNERRRNK